MARLIVLLAALACSASAYIITPAVQPILSSSVSSSSTCASGALFAAEYAALTAVAPVTCNHPHRCRCCLPLWRLSRPLALSLLSAAQAAGRADTAD